MTQRVLFPKSGLPARLKPAFEAFWAAYPPRRPNPRAMAEVAFAKLVAAGVDPDALRQAAAAYAEECAAAKLDAAFVVHARTWLGQRRHLDYPPFAAAPVVAGPAASAEPEHPLWPLLRGKVDAAEFRAWFRDLRYEPAAFGDSHYPDVHIVGPRPFVVQEAARRFGAAVAAAHPGREIVWEVDDGAVVRNIGSAA